MSEPRLEDDFALGIESADCEHGVDAIRCVDCFNQNEAVQAIQSKKMIITKTYMRAKTKEHKMNNETTEELLNKLTEYADKIRHDWSDLATSDGGSLFYFISYWITDMRVAISNELPSERSSVEAKQVND